jgi:hypothetical protein
MKAEARDAIRRAGTTAFAFCCALMSGVLWSPDADANEAARTFDLAIMEGKLAAASNVVRVEQGDAVELRWTADQPTSIELHGYEIKATIAPPAPAIMKFSATIAGRFQVHAEGSGHGHATVLYFEVYPK